MNSQNESIPSITNTSNNKIIFISNTNTPKKKIIRKHNLSTGNLTLKALNNLSLFITNIPSLKDIKKSIDDFYIKNELKNKKAPTPFISNINTTTIRIDFPNEKIMKDYESFD